MLHRLLRFGVLLLLLWSPSAIAFAQTPAGAAAQGSTPPAPAWTFRAAAAAYIFKDDDDYLQPTLTADRGALHLETRYNYEDRTSVSGFAGWNLEWGRALKLEVTPMFGAVAGETDGVIPAFELTLGVSRIEFYAESEYVVNLNRGRNNFLYSWSELSVWATDWLRAGLVTQRTNTARLPREIQRGLLTGVAVGRFDGVAYFFNPGSDDHYYVVSLGVSF